MLYIGYAYAYNLAWWGLKNGKNGGDPNGYLYVFLVRILTIVLMCILSLFCLGDFLVIPPLLFTVHVRPVLSPCQAGDYKLFSHNHAYKN